MTVPIDRLPPHSADAEQAVIGSVLRDRVALADVAAFLAPSDFYQEVHRVVWAAFLALRDDDRPVDAVTVSEYLRSQGDLDRIGGMAYLNAMVQWVPTAANVVHYGEIVRDRAGRRALIGVGEEIVARAHEGAMDAPELAAMAQNLLDRATERPIGPEQLIDFGPAVVQHWRDMYEKRGAPDVGIGTGFVALDGELGGLRGGELGILAARPALGKSSLALALVVNVARQKKAVALYSAEMGLRALAERVVCAEARIDGLALRLRNLDEDTWSTGADCAVDIGTLPIKLDDSPNQTTSSILATARKVPGLALVIVDYLSLLADPQPKGMNYALYLGTLTKRLRRVARALDVPVIVLCQLNRDIEKRGGEPQLSDLRDSGAIEQDADWVLFLWRPSGLTKDAPPSSTICAKFGKSRSGPEGKTLYLRWEPRFTRFSDVPIFSPTHARQRSSERK